VDQLKVDTCQLINFFFKKKKKKGKAGATATPLGTKGTGGGFGHPMGKKKFKKKKKRKGKAGATATPLGTKGTGGGFGHPMVPMGVAEPPPIPTGGGFGHPLGHHFRTHLINQ
jgi:hypothetical protein